jgi:tetratricopeptide (TPR) repeat protein
MKLEEPHDLFEDDRKPYRWVGLGVLLVVLLGAIGIYLFYSQRQAQKSTNNSTPTGNAQTVQSDPQSAADYVNRGNAYFKKGEYDKAIADYTQAIQLNPGSAEVYYIRGNMYSDIKEYDKALTDYAEATRLDPQNPLVHLNRGMVYRDKGEYEKAIVDYTLAIQIDPTFWKATTIVLLRTTNWERLNCAFWI